MCVGADRGQKRAFDGEVDTNGFMLPVVHSGT